LAKLGLNFVHITFRRWLFEELRLQREQIFRDIDNIIFVVVEGHIV